VQCPEDAGLKLPAGFCATIFADGVGHARHMVVSPDNTVYVNTWSGRYYPPNDVPPAGGFLLALRDEKGSGKADVIRRFGATRESGAAGGLGIGLYNGALYAEEKDRILRYSLPAGQVVPESPPQNVVSGLPLTGDHPMHPFVIDAGTLYVSSASATNVCQPTSRSLKSPGQNPCRELQTRAGIWRYDATRTDQKFSPAGRYATGIRNAEGFALDTLGHRIFVTQHGRDRLHTIWPTLYAPEQEATLPAEELLLLQKDGDFGWPYCYYDAALKSLVLAPEYGGDTKSAGLCTGKQGPFAAFPAHWAPAALAFYDHDQFPGSYRNGVFVAFHGSWNRAPYAQQGYNVVYLSLAGGAGAGRCEIFADGFAGAEKTPDGATYRPAGLAVGPDGALYIADDIRGRIYRVTFNGDPTQQAADAAFTPCPDLSAPAGRAIGTDVAALRNGGVADVTKLPVPAGATLEQVVLGSRIYGGEIGATGCIGCHGVRANGSPLGPDLTDNVWLWSDGSVAGIRRSIVEGVPMPKQYRSAMPAAGGAQLDTSQLSALAAYLWAISHQPQPRR
jgi:glucose/arabinose dehydrogenase/mono/diheme cytochrome c family protein